MLTHTDESGSLAYTVTGDGPPVVLVHPGIADHRYWDAVVPALAARHTVVAVDMRGFGESAPPAGPFDEVDDLRRVLDHLGLSRVRLVGSSFGGLVALQFAVAHPDRVAALAVISPPWPGFDWSAEMVAYDDAETAALEAGDLDAAVDINLDQWLRGPARGWDAVDPSLAELVRGPMRTALAHQAVRDEHSADTPPGDPATVTAPTLVGIGTLDLDDFRTIARRYADTVPGARYVEFPGTAHLVALEAPAELSAALTAFLADIP